MLWPFSVGLCPTSAGRVLRALHVSLRRSPYVEQLCVPHTSHTARQLRGTYTPVMTIRGTKKPTIWLVVALCVIAVAVGASAVIAGVAESGKKTPVVASSPSKLPSALAVRPTRSSAPIPQQTRSPAPTPQQTRSPAPTPDPRQSFLKAPTTAAPEAVETPQAQAPAPAKQPARPAQQQKVCPTGVVTSGLMNITVTNERYTTVAGVRTEVDVIGQGIIRNGTTAPVYVYSSPPSIEGLDVNGRLTTYLDTNLDWKPAPGEPRPYQVTLQPGQELTYSVTRNGLSTGTLQQTVAWHVEPEDAVDRYSDFDTYNGCFQVPVTAPPGGTSIMNAYKPWGQ